MSAWCSRRSDSIIQHFRSGKIDEGHLLTHDALEALRLLTNHRLDTESPFATILLGQPTLATKMALGILAALEQRITVRRTMTGMTSQETAAYVRHHVQLAGRSDPLFTDGTPAAAPRSAHRWPDLACLPLSGLRTK
jgi:type II secretory pathway predicted ATPase ExeA